MGFKYFAFTVLFFISSAFAGPSDWSQAEMDDTTIWLHKKNTDITGSLQSIKRDGPLDWTNIDKKKFYQDLEERKKRSLSIIGVKNWIASEYKFVTKDGVESLEIKGSYIDPSGVEVVFKELHLFQADETLQLLYTQPSSLSGNKNYEQEFFTFALAGAVK